MIEVGQPSADYNHAVEEKAHADLAKLRLVDIIKDQYCRFIWPHQAEVQVIATAVVSIGIVELKCDTPVPDFRKSCTACLGIPEHPTLADPYPEHYTYQVKRCTHPT